MFYGSRISNKEFLEFSGFYKNGGRKYKYLKNDITLSSNVDEFG